MCLMRATLFETLFQEQHLKKAGYRLQVEPLLHIET